MRKNNNYQFTGDFMYSKITDAANNAWQELAAEKTKDQAGYVYIYTATESNTNVDIYFDDFDIRVEQTHIVAGNDYYPFGLPIVARSYEKQDYRYDYQSLSRFYIGRQYSEKDDETGYNAFQLRQYACPDAKQFGNARIGRWISPDSYGQFWSPYLAMGNNPVIGIDPDGGECPTCLNDFLNAGGKLMDEVVVVGSAIKNVGLEVYSGLAASANAFNNQVNQDYLEGLFQHFQNHVKGLDYMTPKDISSVTEAGTYALLGYEEYNITGQALEKIKSSPGAAKFDGSLIVKAMADPNFGVKAFSFLYSNRPISFGGDKASGDMRHQLYNFWKPEYRDTWRVASKELTWLIRNATVSGWVYVNASGRITIHHNLKDVLDLEPSVKKNDMYNDVTGVLGSIWHGTLGASAPKVRATWTTIY